MSENTLILNMPEYTSHINKPENTLLLNMPENTLLLNMPENIPPVNMQKNNPLTNMPVDLAKYHNIFCTGQYYTITALERDQYEVLWSRVQQY